MFRKLFIPGRRDRRVVTPGLPPAAPGRSGCHFSAERPDRPLHPGIVGGFCRAVARIAIARQHAENQCHPLTAHVSRRRPMPPPKDEAIFARFSSGSPVRSAKAQATDWAQLYPRSNRAPRPGGSFLALILSMSGQRDAMQAHHKAHGVVLIQIVAAVPVIRRLRQI